MPVTILRVVRFWVSRLGSASSLLLFLTFRNQKKKKWEQRTVLGGSGLARTWAPISCGVHSALAYIDIHIYIYVYIYVTFGRYLRMPAWFFFFFRLENDCDWISMESNPLDGKKKRESTWNTLFLKRKLKTVAAERGTIIYLWYSTFFSFSWSWRILIFFFFALGFHFSSLIYRRNFFLPFPPFPSFLSKCYIEAENLLFFFRGSFSFFLLFCCCTFFFYCCCCVQVTI